MQILGIDLGFSQVKLTSASGNKKFSSVIGYPSSVELKQQEDEKVSESNLYLTEKNTTYYIGEKANRDTNNARLTFTAEKTNNITDHVKYLAALGLASEQDDQGSYTVVTGLPVEDFAAQEDLRKDLEKNLTGTFDYVFGNQAKLIGVHKVHVIPQSAGAYYCYILQDGEIRIDRVNTLTLVIDIGFKTTDAVAMRDAKYSSTESFTEYTGVSNVHIEIRKRLMKEFGLRKELSEIDEIVRSKTIYLDGREVSIEDMILEAVKPFAEKIVDAIPLYISNPKEIRQIILTGGGAYLMQEYFKMAFPKNSILVLPNAEYSNAEGYYKYGQLLAKSGRE